MGTIQQTVDVGVCTKYDMNGWLLVHIASTYVSMPKTITSPFHGLLSSKI